MSEDIKEIIDLELKTNFDAQLKKDIGSYAKFQKDAGNISRSIEDNINNMHRQIVTSLSGVVSSTQKTIIGASKETQKAMRGIQGDLHDVNKSLEEFIKKSHRYQAQAAIKTDQFTSGKINQNQFNEQMEMLTSSFSAEQKGHLSSIYEQFGKISADATEAMAKQAKASWEAVDASARKTKQSIDEAEIAINQLQNAQSVAKGKQALDTAEKQLKDLTKMVDQQSKEMIAAEQQVAIAKEAMLKQTNEKMKIQQQEYYEIAVENATKIAKEFKKSEKVVEDLSNRLSKDRVGIRSGAQEAKEKISVQVDDSEVIEIYENLKNNFIKTIRESARGTDEEFKKLVVSGNILKETFASAVQGIKNLLQEAKQLNQTGLVDTTKEIQGLQNILDKTKQFESEFKELQKITKHILPTEMWQAQINLTKENIQKVQAEIKKNMQMTPSFKEGVGIFDVKKAKEQVDTIEKLNGQLLSQRNSLQKQIDKIEKESHVVRIEMTKTSNTEVRNAMEAHLKELEARAYKLTETMNKAYSPDLSGIKSKIKNAAESINQGISESFQKLNRDPSFEQIEAQYKQLGTTFDKLRDKKFGIDADAFSGTAKKLKANIEDYKKRIISLSDEIRKFKQMQQSGLGGSPVKLEEMTQQLNQMRNNVQELNRMSVRASQQMEQVNARAAKSIFRSTWETVRNFRWQVAAIIYLANKAVAAVQRTFLNLMNSIQKYRTDVMAIGSSITYSVLGDTKRAFDGSVEYAKKLMLQMELQAAKTILTLEDMAMLTKTFTQAGTIPKNALDVEKISTVGTAIKILTEGMANAGVQMRQELYALLQGRQRAVDQVAMMFKMIGIDINKQLDEARKRGEDTIDVLAKALEPFNQVNKTLEKEFGAQLNKARIIIERIKRIAGEVTFQSASRTLEAFNNKLMDSEGNLTNLGKKITYDLGIVLLGIQNSLKMFKDTIGSLFSGEGDSSAMLEFMRAANGIIAVLTAIPDSVIVAVKIITQLIAGAFTALENLNSTKWGIFNSKGREQLKKDMEFMGREITQTFEDYLTKQEDNIWGFERNIKKLEKTIKDSQKEAPQDILKDIFSLDPNLFEDMVDIKNKAEAALGNSLSGLDRISFDYNKGIEEYAEAKESLTNALQRAEKKFGELWKRGVSQDVLDAMSLKIQEISTALSEIGVLEDNLKKERDKKTEELFENERQKIISLKAEYENLFESMSVTTTPLQQAEKQINKMFISVDKFIEKNKDKFGDLGITVKDFWDRFNLWAQEATDGALENIENTFDSMMERINSHKVLSPFERIQNEFARLRVEINKLNIDDNLKQQLLEQADAAEKTRIEIEKLNQAHETYSKQLALRETYTKLLMENAVTPLQKQQAEIKNLSDQWAKASYDTQKEIDQIYELWTTKIVDAFGNEQIEWKFGSKEAQQQVAILQYQLALVGKSIQTQKDKVINPAIEEMKNKFQDWGNSFADVLTDMMFDFKSFGEGLANLAEQIARDIANAFIRHNITNQMLNMMGGFFTLPSTGQVPIQNPRAAGGWVTEPVVGVGLRSGESYSFGERESEFVTPKSKMGSSGANVTVNVVNQTTQEVTAEQGTVKFDGEKYIMDVFIKNISNNPNFRRMMKGG